MTNQRWQVLHGSTCLGHHWIAQLKEDGPGAIFDTWREAMDYADRMSRTVEVELPPWHTGRVRLPAHNGQPGGHPGGYTLIPRDEDRYCAITISGPWGECGIFDPQDIKPLALALLAHHHNNQDTP